MNPDPNNVSIRLEIQVPSGPDRAGIRMAGPGQEGPDFERYYDWTVPDNGDRYSVLPDGTGLGLICATVKYGTAMSGVKAWIYPALQYPSLPIPPWTHPVHPTAVLGTTTDNGYTWIWKHPPVAAMVPGAAHLPASMGGAPDYLGIWYKRPGYTYRFDDSPLFYGITDPVPCGSGSGSTSGMMMMEGVPETLMISVGDGPYAGRHYAKRSGREWALTVGRECWVVTPGPGVALTIHVGRRAVPGKVTGSPPGSAPFSATFPGEAFGSKADVTVTPG